MSKHCLFVSIVICLGMISWRNSVGEELPTIEEIEKGALATYGAIKSAKVTYDVTWNVLKTVPGLTSHNRNAYAPYRATVVWFGERRYFLGLPQN